MTPLRFRPMLPGDAVLLSLQPSQHYELGLEHKSYTIEEGEDLAAGLAWTAYRGSEIVAVAGFKELFKPGSGHAVAWAALSAAIGADHLAITRFAGAQIADAPFRRIEAIVERANVRALKWAEMVGLRAVHLLRAYGPEGADHVLFEKVTVQ